MSKITLNNLVNLQNETTAVNTINNNNSTIVTAFDNTLSRDGTQPNTMDANIDMNSNRILNLPTPLGDAEPLRLTDLSKFNSTGTIQAIPAGGTTGQVLSKTNDTDYAVQWSSSAGTVSSVALSMPSDLLTVTGSPVTTTGTLTGTKPTQAANLVYAGPTTGSADAPTFRAQVPADLPTITLSGDVSASGSGGVLTTSIGTNKVANTQLAQAADSTIKSNISGGAGNLADNTITAVLDKQLGSSQGTVVYRNATAWTGLSPGTNGQVLTSAGTSANPSWTTISGSGTVTNIATSGILTGGPITTTGTLGVDAALRPSGRLTLSTGVPVLVSTVSAATAVLYTPYIGNLIPIYDGSKMVPTVFSELTNTLTDATKNPAAVSVNSAYDLFVWNDSGTIRLSRGPAWTTVQARSAGTALARTNGILLNSVSITNGPAANRGTYVGSIVTNNTSTVDFIFGGDAVGGSAATFGVWNMYNRVDTGTDIRDTGSGYTYSSSTVRQARGGTGMNVTIMRGLQEDCIWASYGSRATTAAASTATASWGLGLDSSTAFSGQYSQAFAPTANAMASASTASKQLFPGVGFHTVFANEQSDGTNANTFNSGAIGTLSVRFMC